MDTLNPNHRPEDRQLLVAFFDLTSFARFAQSRSSREVFDTLSDYYEFVGNLVEGSGGKVIKFIGDAGLVVYPEDKVNAGVLALKELKDRGDAWLEDRGTPCRNVVTIDFGPVVTGPIGTRSEKRLDVFGHTVNTAATLRSNGFAMTPQVFRKLAPDTRKRFKKHTPPVTYIPVEAAHRD